jgi:hypothetical protein
MRDMSCPAASHRLSHRLVSGLRWSGHVVLNSVDIEVNVSFSKGSEGWFCMLFALLSSALFFVSVAVWIVSNAVSIASSGSISIKVFWLIPIIKPA